MVLCLVVYLLMIPDLHCLFVLLCFLKFVLLVWWLVICFAGLVATGCVFVLPLLHCFRWWLLVFVVFRLLYNFGWFS